MTQYEIYEVRITELQKLAEGLIAKGKMFYYRPMFGGGQIIVFDEDIEPSSDDWSWDAVCHHGSYGRENGTLEIMGECIVHNDMDTVEGWLTAEEILERVE